MAGAAFVRPPKPTKRRSGGAYLKGGASIGAARGNTRPAPAPSPGPVKSAPISGGGGGSSSGGGGGSSSPAPKPKPKPKPPSKKDWLKDDASYQAQLASLKKAVENYLSDTKAQRSKYNTKYDTSVTDLGWMGKEDGWNREDQNTSSGRAYQNLNNDFAGRGMLQSSAYGDAVDDLFRSLDDQYSAMNTAKDDFMSDLDRQVSQYKDKNTSSRQQARAESLARRAAKYTDV